MLTNFENTKLYFTLLARNCYHSTVGKEVKFIRICSLFLKEVPYKRDYFNRKCAGILRGPTKLTVHSREVFVKRGNSTVLNFVVQLEKDQKLILNNYMDVLHEISMLNMKIQA